MYVKIPENHIVIDFDIPDKDGNKYLTYRFLYTKEFNRTQLEEYFRTINSDNSIIPKSKLALSSIYGSCVMQREEPF